MPDWALLHSAVRPLWSDAGDSSTGSSAEEFLASFDTVRRGWRLGSPDVGGGLMSEPLLHIRNHHSAFCGDPPIVNGNDPALYIGYFENAYSEQWIFTYNRDTKKAELRGGDVGWNRTFEVVGPTVPELILSREEAMWLASCWKAATVT